jgi:2-(1,2-epoxy-1,2-dihydrophenyl)acetyl-CoA isomerase
MTRNGVRVSVTDQVAEVVLDAGHRSNALDLQLSEALLAAVTELSAAAGVRAVLLRGEGRHFCVGGDLHDFKAHSDDIVAHIRLLAETVNAAVQTLVRMPVPVVVAVHGAIAGAGLGLALSGDVCVAGASSRFSTAYLAVGLSPDAGVSALLPMAVGQRRAMELLLTNRPIDAQQALAWGMVTEVVADDQLSARAMELAQQLARLPDQAVAATKRLIRAGFGQPLTSQLDAEADSISQLAGSEQARAAIDGFVHR